MKKANFISHETHFEIRTTLNDACLKHKRALTCGKVEQLFFIQLILCYTIKIIKNPDNSKLKRSI